MIIKENDKQNLIFSTPNQNFLDYQVNEGGLKRKNAEIKRKLILTFIEQDPGITYKDLLRKTCLSNGSLSWNIKILEVQKRLHVSRTSNGNTHLYPIYLDESTCSLLTEIRREKTKEIIFILLAANEGYCTLKEISSAIEKAPSTTWWHLKKMYLKGTVFKKKNKRSIVYGLHDRDKIINLMADYSIL